MARIENNKIKSDVRQSENADFNYLDLVSAFPKDTKQAAPHRSDFVNEAIRLPKIILEGLSNYDFLPNYPDRAKRIVDNMRTEPNHPFTKIGENHLVSLAGVRLTIDNDGAGGNKDGDPSHKGDTTWHCRGRALDAYKVAYVAVPADLARWNYNPKGQVDLGTLVIVERHGKMVACVAGDVGNKTTTSQGRGIGEISVHAAEMLNVNKSPTNGGTDDHNAKVIFTNEKVLGIKDEELQKQASAWLHKMR